MMPRRAWSPKRQRSRRCWRVLPGWRSTLPRPGRTSTQAGNLKLADARVLVEALQTGDEFEMEIGDKSLEEALLDPAVRSRSLAVVGPRVRCAATAGEQACRGQGVATSEVTSDPMGEVRRSFWTLVGYGVLESYWWHLRAPVAEALDASVSGMLTALLTAPEPIEFEDLEQLARAVM